MRFFVDDVPLLDASKRWDVLSTSTIAGALSARTPNITIPGMYGVPDLPMSPLEAPQITLAMRFFGADQDEMMANYDAVTALIRRGRVLRRLAATVDQNTAMQFISSSEPTYLQVANQVHATYIVRLNGVFWRGPLITWNSAVAAFPMRIMQFNNMTGIVFDAQVMVKGTSPAAKPLISCGDSWMKLDVDLTDTEYAMIDTATFKAHVSTSLNWDRSGTGESTSLETSGDPYALMLEPTMLNGDPRQTATTITVTGASDVWVRGKAAYTV